MKIPAPLSPSLRTFDSVAVAAAADFVAADVAEDVPAAEEEIAVVVVVVAAAAAADNAALGGSGVGTAEALGCARWVQESK
jgi:hypothetical protein